MKNGDMSGTNLSYAVVQDTKDRILFMRDEVPEPPRGALVIISSDEGYVVDNVEPPDGISVTAEVTRLDAAEMSGRPTPDEITAGS